MQTHAEKHREGETKVAGKSNMKLSQMLLVSLFSWLGKQMKLYIRNPFFFKQCHSAMYYAHSKLAKRSVEETIQSFGCEWCLDSLHKLLAYFLDHNRLVLYSKPRP